MFHRVLIANRGEIACRITRTCRRLGISSIAVYSDADAGAPHVRAADLAARIGPSPVSESYLNVEAILAAARHQGADAIHPGYGLLSENAEFAEAVQEAGLTFVGPSPASIRLMADKSRARAHMIQVGVPVVPGTESTVEAGVELQRQAAAIGYPLMVKASAGGGGIGMTIVRSSEQLDTAVGRAGRTAARSFGSGSVYLERYLQEARHIEVQVFGDRHGAIIHLGDRECSVQRRHQKVLEEAPAPGLSEALRRRLTEAAMAAARSVDYVGAGTVEFLLDHDGEFYFLEMNTRLQVEHPVTEMVTGLDLVELQLQVAAGRPLDVPSWSPNGHAIECRLYAEDPHTHLPSPGLITRWRMPEGECIRVDAGVEDGSLVTQYYDPLLAKLIAWDNVRSATIARMQQALNDTDVGGIATNLPLLRRLLQHARFVEGRYDTGVMAALIALGD